MSFWGEFNFQNISGGVYSELETLHDLVMVWLVVILAVVTVVTLGVFISNKGVLTPDSELLEKGWTLIPMLILFTIAIPSIRLLCLQDAMCQSPSFSVKVISSQWSWQSEWEDLFDHLLDSEVVDNVGAYETPLLMVSNTIARLLVTSTDVLHSIGVPAFGLKLDSVPGRLNVTTVETLLPGFFVGSCYELCGSGHSVMPLNVFVI